jgi:hypothetical protein
MGMAECAPVFAFPCARPPRQPRALIPPRTSQNLCSSASLELSRSATASAASNLAPARRRVRHAGWWRAVVGNPASAAERQAPRPNEKEPGQPRRLPFRSPLDLFRLKSNRPHPLPSAPKHDAMGGREGVRAGMAVPTKSENSKPSSRPRAMCGRPREYFRSFHYARRPRPQREARRASALPGRALTHPHAA